MREIIGGVIPHLGLLLLTSCNLNCRDCADLIPYRPVRYYKKDDVFQDLQRVLDAVEAIGEVLLIGGEVLLYKDLPEVLTWCLQEPRIHKVVLTTNGTLMPSEELIQLLTDSKVVMRVSGYNDQVAPNRSELIQMFKTRHIQCEDLENMTWYDVGDENNRGRSTEELTETFQNCMMADCVGMQADGWLTFCSREMVAIETELYPTPKEYEYVNVRAFDDPADLRKRLEEFYSLPYISTCQYCDGIVRGRENRALQAAVQMPDKEMFLSLLELMQPDTGDPTTYVMQSLKFIQEHLQELEGLQCLEEVIDVFGSLRKIEMEEVVRISGVIRRLASELSKAYNIEVRAETPECKSLICERQIYNNRNHILVDVFSDLQNVKDSMADVIFSVKDVYEEAQAAFLMDGFDYNRLYLSAEMETKRDVTGAIFGLSYNQYGIDVSRFNDQIANIAVTSVDLRYSLTLAMRFYEMHPGIKWMAFCLPYYDIGYDLEDSKRSLHLVVKDRVLRPVLMNVPGKPPVISPFERIFQFPLLQETVEQNIKESIDGKNYYNELNQRSGVGALETDFKLWKEEERYRRALKTVRSNDMAFDRNKPPVIVNVVTKFLEKMKSEQVKILFYTPPYTRYLYEQMDDKTESCFKELLLPVFESYQFCTYLDLMRDERFTDADFEDFEHLGGTGAIKLSDIINTWATE